MLRSVKLGRELHSIFSYWGVSIPYPCADMVTHHHPKELSWKKTLEHWNCILQLSKSWSRHQEATGRSQGKPVGPKSSAEAGSERKGSTWYLLLGVRLWLWPPTYFSANMYWHLTRMERCVLSHTDAKLAQFLDQCLSGCLSLGLTYWSVQKLPAVNAHLPGRNDIIPYFSGTTSTWSNLDQGSICKLLQIMWSC